MKDKPLFLHVTEAHKAAAPPKLSTHPIVVKFVDTCRELHQKDPPKQVRTRVGVEAKKLLQEGIDQETMLRGAEILAQRGMDPAMLSSAVFSAQAELGPNGRDTRMLREFREQHGNKWPTGGRMIRGTHSAQIVYDALGFDPVPLDFPHARPSRADVLDALRAEKENASRTL